MSENEAGPKGKTGWTDREMLVYLFALVEHSGVKFDYQNTPRPAGRTVRACSQRIDKLKNTLKDDLEVLKSGQAIDEATPKKATGTPKTARKRKGNEDAEATPTKKGRKQNSAADKIEDEEETVIKGEIEDEFCAEA